MSTQNNASCGGIGVVGYFGVLFVALKLTGYIDWSWWWVLAPLWGGFAVALAIIAIIIVVAVIVELRKPVTRRR
jgi:hypothetical protein